MKFILTSDTHYGIDGKSSGKQHRFWKKIRTEIYKHNIKAVLWAGDIASHRQRHLVTSIKIARKYISKPILVVRGNHDFWDGIHKKDKLSGKRTLDKIFKEHQELFKIHDIHHLEDNPFIIDDVFIAGFDGWYATPFPNTNDKNWMPKTIEGQPFVMQYLVNKAWKDLEACLAHDTSKFRKSILVTHHNLYYYSKYTLPKTTDQVLNMGINFWEHSGNFKFLPVIRDKFDVLCCGHTHAYKNDYNDGIQIYNCGSDYGDPKYLIFEV